MPGANFIAYSEKNNIEQISKNGWRICAHECFRELPAKNELACSVKTQVEEDNTRTSAKETTTSDCPFCGNGGSSTTTSSSSPPLHPLHLHRQKLPVEIIETETWEQRSPFLMSRNSSSVDLLGGHCFFALWAPCSWYFFDSGDAVATPRMTTSLLFLRRSTLDCNFHITILLQKTKPFPAVTGAANGSSTMTRLQNAGIRAMVLRHSG